MEAHSKRAAEIAEETERTGHDSYRARASQPAYATATTIARAEAIARCVEFQMPRHRSAPQASTKNRATSRAPGHGGTGLGPRVKSGGGGGRRRELGADPQLSVVWGP